MSQMKDERQRMYSRFRSKSGAIKDLLCSRKNEVAVKEELAEFNDILKLVVTAQE